uniref:ATP synthase complex subunit 8 n=1 Tax=Coleoptera sp. ACP-2013 TaxID=2485033 RepID=A0A3G3MEN5_9COLE|nr:ATP synthase F0 subunit 8 [Coleoptera sp. ACP-2013]
MPQMAPMSWLTLYILFILMFMLMIILNYYTFMYSPKNNNKYNKKNKIILNWKW